MKNIVSIDPGRDKCGLILANIETFSVVEGRVALRSNVLSTIRAWEKLSPIELIVLGNGTTSLNLQKDLCELAPIKVVAEKGTTMRARYRYWEIWPPGFFLRFFSKSIIFPPKNLDAIAALIILEDYLGTKLNWEGSYKIKI